MMNKYRVKRTEKGWSVVHVGDTRTQVCMGVEIEIGCERLIADWKTEQSAIEHAATLTTKPLYKREFGIEHWDIPKEIIDSFEDVSWHNDICPSFEIYPGLSLFVSPKLREDRENPEMDRFAILDVENGKDVYTSDEESSTIRLAQYFKEAWKQWQEKSVGS